MIVRALVAILFLATLCSQYNGHPLNLPPNAHWQCIECHRRYGSVAGSADERESVYRIFGIIRNILHKAEARMVYFALDSTWMDRLLHSEARVKVTAVSLDGIQSLVMATPSPLALPANERDEVFQVVYAELSPDTTTGTGTKPALYGNHYENVDTFLSQNPCWIPLHEPVLGRQPSPPSTPKPGHRFSQHSKQRSVVLVRLPVWGMHATCRLFDRITRLQYPQTCLYDNEHMLTHHLHNTGWSATFNAILFKLAHILHQDVFPRKLIAITRAIDFRSRERRLQDRNGTVFNATGGWYWANPETCRASTDAYDPWACNFISLSNCTREERGTSLLSSPFPKASRDYNWETPQTLRWKGFDLLGGNTSDSIETLRSRFGDAPLFGEEQWAYSRYHTFLQRPNGRLRAHIRRSLRNLEFLERAHLSAGALTSWRGRGESDREVNVLKKQQPCITIHVRHGDSRHDTRGNKNRRIDRSLAAHVLHARNLTLALGVSNIFLASDNLSVIAHAAQDHPYYHWSTQRRPIKDWTGMYDVHNEDDMQLELAHVIADTRIAATCEAIVGSFDSGFAEQMLVAGCQHSKHGHCPPTVDLREVYKDYG